ncbi:MAG: aminotransferase class IV [Saprospiraceae bacterium]
MSRLIETICIRQGQVQNLAWHQRRLDKTFEEIFPGEKPHSLSDLIMVHESFDVEKVKCRFLYDSKNVEIQFLPYQKHQIESLLFLEHSDLVYNYKWENREVLDKGKDLLLPFQSIVFLKNKLITDGIYSNVAFLKNGKWYTPAHPVLEGTCRARLLELGIIQPSVIKTSDLHQFESVRLFNAMTGWEDSWEIPMEKTSILK